MKNEVLTRAAELVGDKVDGVTELVRCAAFGNTEVADICLGALKRFLSGQDPDEWARGRRPSEVVSALRWVAEERSLW